MRTMIKLFEPSIRQRRSQGGLTLLEVLMAMVILALITGGIFTTFFFSRRVSWRSETQVMVQAWAQQTADRLRLSIAGPMPGSSPAWQMTAGYYVDANMPSPPNAANGTAPTVVTWLNLPAEMTRFQTTAADGARLYVERADTNNNGITDEDYDGDGQIGLYFGNLPITRTDAFRVRLRVKWTVPSQ